MLDDACEAWSLKESQHLKGTQNLKELDNAWGFATTWHGLSIAHQYLGFFDLWANLGI